MKNPKTVPLRKNTVFGKINYYKSRTYKVKTNTEIHW